MRILISGAGVAGPTLAYWLRRHGYQPSLVEKAPELRAGGYVVDFWGAGYDVAEWMGLLPELRRKGYFVEEVRMVDRDGRRVGGFAVSAFRRYTQGRFVSLARGDLAATIYDALGGQVETLFGDSVVALEETSADVRVRFERSAPRAFDLVIGADGLHSEVRRLVFGPQPAVERRLGYHVAAFEAAGYRPRDENVYVMYTQVGQQAARFSMRNDRTLFLFVVADRASEPASLDGLSAQRSLLRSRFRDGGWECREIIDEMEGTTSLYFDRISQIRMDYWTHGRVALVGDAAFCVSLLAGQGSALAMVAAYVLAGELKAAGGDHVRAFARYEERLTGLITGKQDAAVGFAGFFAPRTRAALFWRNQATRLLALPLVAGLFVRRELVDKTELPNF